MGYFSDKSKREKEILTCLQELKNEMRGLKDGQDIGINEIRGLRDEIKSLRDSQKALDKQISELKDRQNASMNEMKNEIGKRLQDARERLVHIENRANEILHQETGDIYLTIEKE